MPDSNTFTFSSAGTYYFWAVYGGDDNNNGDTSGCDTEIVVVDKNSPDITTQVKNDADDSNVANGGHVAIGTVVYDTALLTGETSDASGTVTYYVEKSDAACSIAGATSLGAKTVTAGAVPNSNTFTFSSAGTYYFWAVYGGDDNNNGDTSGCDTEIVVVDKNSPDITTQVKNDADDSNVANGGHVAIGTVVYDTALLTGETSDASGTVTYYVEKSDAACSIAGATSLGAKTVTAGAVPDSNTFTFSSAGTYYFWAVYGGDDNNNGDTSGCDTEIVVVDKNSPDITTQVKNDADDSNVANGGHVAIGTVVYDTALLTGETSDASGTVTYYVEKSDAACSIAGATSLGAKTVTAGAVPDSNTFTFSSAGTYYFWAVYGGDDNNNGDTSGCDTEIVVVDKNSPDITTQVKNDADDSNVANGGHVAIGTVVYDTALLTGETSDASGTVTYYVEKSDAACSIAGATSLGAKTVTAGAVPDSNTFTFSSAGTYYFWAVYGGDDNNNGDTSGCDTEIVVVDKNSPDITTTPNLLPNDTIDVAGLADPGSNGYGDLIVELRQGGEDGVCDGTVIYDITFSPGTANDFTGNGEYKTKNTTILVEDDAVLHWCTTYTGDDNNEAYGPSDEGEIIDIDFNPSDLLVGFGLGLSIALWSIFKRRRTDEAV